MMIKDMQIQKDPWRHLDDENAVLDNPFTVSWDRWETMRDTWPEGTTPIGVRVTTDIDPHALGQDAHQFGIIIVDYPIFTDGRGHSVAYLLRTRYGYSGELRAAGYVTRDQVGYLRRCGFDAIVLKDGKDPHDALQGFGELATRYQPSADGNEPVWRRRVAEVAANTEGSSSLSPTVNGEA